MNTKHKIVSMIWKCAILRKKHWIMTILGVGFPILLFAAFGYFRCKIMAQEYIDTPTYPDIQKFSDKPFSPQHLLYSKETNFTRKLIERIQLDYQLTNNITQGFASEEELMSFFQKTNEPTIAVVFDNLNGDEMPSNLSYKIRHFQQHVKWTTTMNYQTFDEYIEGTGSMMYFSTDFITLQTAIDLNFIKMRNQFTPPIEINYQEFPYPPYIKGAIFTKIFVKILTFLTMFSFMLVVPASLKHIAEEKVSGIKELLKMMGLPPSVMWITWFFNAFILNVISVIVMVILMKISYGSEIVPLTYCDPILFGIFLMLYCAIMTLMCFIFVTVLSSPKYITLIASVVWIVTYTVVDNILEYVDNLPLVLQILLCMLPNGGLIFGYSAISKFEEQGDGLQWNNFFSSPKGYESFLTMGSVLIIMIFDINIYYFLVYYLDSVHPGQYGIKKSWSFPFKKCKKHTDRKTFPEPAEEENSENIELNIFNQKPGVELKHLYKFYNEKTAVNNLTLNLYKSEITILLGHNGAGKTTAMSIMCGMIKASRGSILINDYDLDTELDKVRTLIGICPQHNLLFPDLTVYEHLKFFSLLNNIQDYDDAIRVILQQLNLESNKNLIPAKLSGGMKRKLCLGIALISKPKVLILDEPTSGLDPKSRREIWDVLLSLRKSEGTKNCTILISTHFMEEAEALGDRIAIMDHGTLVAYGTPMFLKNKFNTGYFLTITKSTENIGNESIDFIVKEIMPERIPKFESMEITYLLPNDKTRILQALKKLEDQKEDLGIKNIGISITTLEDVYLKIASHVNESDNESDDNIVMPVDFQETSKSILNQMQVLLQNHLFVVRKSLPTYLLFMLVGLLFVISTVILSKPSSQIIYEIPELKLDLSTYPDSNVYCSIDVPSSSLQRMADFYIDAANGDGAKALQVKSVYDELIKSGTENIVKFKKNDVVSAQFNSTDGLIVNVMYSNSALHGAPISLNLVTNTLAKMFAPDSEIHVANAPLPQAHKVGDVEGIRISFTWAFFFTTGLVFFCTCFVIHPYKENNTQLKHMIFIIGVSKALYWLTMFVFDLILYLMGVVVIILIILISTNPMFNGFCELSTLTWILFDYGVVMIPLVYLFSYRKSIISALNSLTMLNMCAGTILVFVIMALVFSGTAATYYGEKMHLVLMYVPQYWLTYSVYNFSSKAVENYKWNNMDETDKQHICAYSMTPCCKNNQSAECQESMAYTIENVYLFPIMAIVFFIILIGLDSMTLKKVVNKFWDRIYGTIRLDENGEDKGLLAAKNLSKRYRKRIAAKNISFNVNHGACFGLLGVNGAGKTTTFNMLTGYTMPNSGTANIKSEEGDERFDLVKQNLEYLQRIGYCPQYNALNEQFTGRELLTFFAKLKGIVKLYNDEVNNLINALGLAEYGDIKCGHYSGGNKRKLCLGIALIANPPVILLDEPTSGVDPLARRNLWKVLRKLKATKKHSIVLTSHSMDECEALCDELAIVVLGEMKYRDNITNLKMQYGKGFSILIKVKRLTVPGDAVDSRSSLLKESEVDAAEESFISQYRDRLQPTLKDKHLSLLEFYVSSDIKLSELFECMETFKKSNEFIDDYTINMATLEDVFLSLSEYKHTEQD